ncbi:MAG: hypothetical protein ACI4ND_05820 [Succinivibrio sp.]
MRLMHVFKCLLTYISLAVILSACQDKSVPSSENLIEAINNEISKQNVYLPLPGASTVDGTVKPPIVLVDFANPKNAKSYFGIKDSYQKKLLDYAELLRKRNLLSMKEASFPVKFPFRGVSTCYGYILEFSPQLNRTLSPSKYYEISKAILGNLEVKEIVRSTYPFVVEGLSCIDITFSVKLSQYLDNLTEDVMIASFVKEEVANAQTTYRLYLDESSKSWKVLDPKPLKIDPVKRFFRYVVNE